MASNLDELMASQFEGNFLDATDLMTANKTVTIKEVIPPNTEKDKDGKGRLIDRAIISFEGCKKRLILNKINAKIIAMAHGKKSSLWAGKKITLTHRWLKEAFGQTNVPVVRVMPPDGMSLTFGMRKNFGAATSFNQEKGPE